MVLSLAFILAFVASAIVLLIGIVIFSEVVEGMEITLPLPSTPTITFDDQWQVREQQFFPAINGTNGLGDDINITPPFETRSEASERGWLHVFKVFDKSDIIGKDLEITWNLSRNFNSIEPAFQIKVIDGSYDRNVASDFPLNNNTDGFSLPLKGAGILNIFTRDGSPQGDFTDSISMTLVGSTESKVTVSMTLRDESGLGDAFPNNIIGAFNFPFELSEIKVGTDTWTWDSSASISMAITGTENDLGVTNANFTGTTTTLTFTSSEQQQIDTFNNAQAIGFTVIGILPVALFFALFSIFSGRFE